MSDRRVRSVFATATLIISLAVSVSAIAQQGPVPPPPTVPNPSAGGNLLNFFSARTPYEFWLTCLIAFVGLIIIWTLVRSLSKLPLTKPDDITRPVIVITVVMGTLILVTAGYSNEQIAPAFGLFGTIVGYILGRLSQSQLAGLAEGSKGSEIASATQGTASIPDETPSIPQPTTRATP